MLDVGCSQFPRCHQGFVPALRDHSPVTLRWHLFGTKTMNSKTTGIWFTIAAALFALIFVFERFLRPAAPEPSRILPELRPPAVTGVQVIPSGALEIRADRTNGAWLLTKPITYPAQPAAIEALLDALQKLTPATRISAAELRNHRNADVEFGFETPDRKS